MPAGMKQPTILIIDDDPNNMAIVTHCLAECDYTILVAEDGESGISRAEYARPDLILLDVMMPWIDGYETCRRLKALDNTRDIPVIFMTALADTDYKVKGFDVGAVDYITKPFQREEVLARVGVHLRIRELTSSLQEAKGSLERRVEQRTMDLALTNRELEEEIAARQLAQEQLLALTQSLEEKIDELKRTQEALQESEKKFRAIFDQTFQMMGVLTPDGILLEANQTALNICGVTESDVIGKPFWDSPWWAYSAELREKVHGAVARAAAGELVRFEANYLARGENFYNIDFSLKPVINDQGEVILLIPEGRDITDIKKLEKELRQSQKMEAIGTLAGGIAHDFNNILTAIIGYTDMAQRKLKNNDAVARDLDRAQEASARAKELVSRILTFSRRSEQEPEPVPVASVVEEVFMLLRSSIPSTIEIRQQIAANSKSGLILADPTQLHQVLMNLGTNAAHAMRERGGVLTVSLSDVEVDASLSALYPDLTPGSFVRLTVSDTGHGMEAHIKERIFDPYFTTKKVGEGSGIGLAVVQGIVKNHGGAIRVDSEPGQGTTFHIFLPKLVAEIAPQCPADDEPSGGTERILFVDDEAMLAELGQELLGSLGYTATVTTNSSEALQLFSSNPRGFDLVITDMTMPGLTGKELACELMTIRPDIPIILCTGYSEHINENQARETGITGYIMKPYTNNSLDKTIRRVLAGG